MKILSTIFGAIFILALFIYYMSTKTIEISDTEFEMEFENSKVQHTVYDYQLLELRDNSIYMSKKEKIPFLNKWKKTILYTNFYNLSIKTQKNINQVLDSNSNDMMKLKGYGIMTTTHKKEQINVKPRTKTFF